MNLLSVLALHLVSASFRMDESPLPGDSVLTEVGSITILGILGEGAYGTVFKADWSGRSVALKVEKVGVKRGFVKAGLPMPDFSRITHEYRMMSLLASTRGFPHVYTANFEGKYKYYAMQLLGKPLSQLFRENGGRLSTRLVIALGDQILNRLEVIHRNGFLMYDMHLNNFLLDNGTVYAIDLGLAIPFLVDGEHIAFGTSFILQRQKNDVFASRRDSQGLTVSRRDELERFLYILVMLNAGSLPWGRVESSWEVMLIKTMVKIDDICFGEAKWLKPAFKYVFGMGFDEEPNYNLLRKLFSDRLDELKEEETHGKTP